MARSLKDYIREKLGLSKPRASEVFTSRVSPELQARAQASYESPLKAAIRGAISAPGDNVKQFASDRVQQTPQQFNLINALRGPQASEIFTDRVSPELKARAQRSYESPVRAFGQGFRDTAQDTSQNFVKVALRAIPQAGIRIGQQIKGDTQPFTVNPNDKFNRIIFGSEPIKPFKQYGEDALGSVGIKDAGKFGLPVGIGLTALDVIPFGPGKGSVLKQLAKARTEKAVLDIAKKAKLNLADDVIKAIVKETDPNKIAALTKTPKLPGGDLASEARKYKSAEEFVKAQPIVYHGSGTPLKKFSNKQGTFFTDDMMNADGYAGGENVYEGFLNLKNPLVIDAKGALHRELDTKWGKTTQEIVGNVDKSKYDGVVFKNIKDSWIDDAEVDTPSTIYYAFRPADSFLNESQLTDIYNQSKLPGGEGKTPERKINIKQSPRVSPEATIAPQDLNALSKVKRVFTSGRTELGKQGEAGKELADLLKKQRIEGDMLGGSAEAKLEQAIRGLKPTQIEEMKSVLAGPRTTNDPTVKKAAYNIREMLDAFATQAEKQKLEIQLPSGVKIPFKKQPNYFPRVYEPGQLTNIKASKRAELLQHLVDTGQAQNIADADNMFEKFIKNQGQRKAGQLEFARSLDLPLKEVKPELALQRYINNSARRLTEVKNFGNSDQVAKELIDQVRQAGGDYRYAQEVFDLFTGQKKYKNAFVDNAVKFGYITKLDLGFITNATQPINSAIKGGVFNTLESILKTYGKPVATGQRARAAGAIEDALIHQDLDQVSMGNIMEWVLSPFSAVEKKNRVSAFTTGESFIKSMAKKLEKNPTSKLAIRQLKSVGLDPELIMARGLQPDDILRGGKEFADNTQFKVDALEVPPGWKTNIGRMLVQFKSFSFKQTGFIRDEVIKEAVEGNVMPLIRLISLAVPASFVAQSVRNTLTGRDPKKEEKALDIRKWDQYLRAFGTMPTDAISQIKFVSDTYKNKYATPLKKVGRTLSSFLGPTVGEGFSLVNAFEQAGTQAKQNQDLPKGKKAVDPYLELKRVATGYVPFIGEASKNLFLSYPKDNVSDFTRVIRAIESQDASALEKALSTYDPKAWKATVKRAVSIVEEQKGSQEFAPTNKVVTGAGASEGSGTSFSDLMSQLSVGGSKKDTTVSVNNIKLDLLKDAGDLDGWMKLAAEQESILEKEMSDPNSTELQRLGAEKKLRALITEAEKYAGYGGFKKGKKGKKKNSSGGISLATIVGSAPKAPKLSTATTGIKLKGTNAGTKFINLTGSTPGRGKKRIGTV